MRWDGKRLWAATKQARILLVDPGERTIRSIGSEEGIPGSSMGMVVCPLGSDRALVVGSLAPHGRAWFAIVTAEGDVDVFHEARDVSRDKKNISATAAFAPTWAIPVASPTTSGDVEKVFVGRRANKLYAGYYALENRPLIVDTVRLAVAPAPFALPDYQDAYSFRPNGLLLKNPTLILVQTNAERIWATDTSNGAVTHIRRGEWGLTGDLLEWGGRILVPAERRWFEIDPVALSAEVLSPVQLPGANYQFRHFPSWHYGVLAFRTLKAFDFFRVHVEPRQRPRVSPQSGAAPSHGRPGT